jgi:hypothetical protein
MASEADDHSDHGHTPLSDFLTPPTASLPSLKHKSSLPYLSGMKGDRRTRGMARAPPAPIAIHSRRLTYTPPSSLGSPITGLSTPLSSSFESDMSSRGWLRYDSSASSNEVGIFLA